MIDAPTPSEKAHGSFGWQFRFRIMAPLLHAILVGAVAYGISGHSDDEYIVFLWVVPAITSAPSSVIALLFANIPTVINIPASPTVLQEVLPTASFVIVGSLQWFLIGRWIDRTMTKRHSRSQKRCTKRIAALLLLSGLSLGVLPLLLYRLIDSLLVYGLGDAALAFIIPTLATWGLAGLLILIALYGLIRFPRAWPPGYCVGCGYDLRGSSQRCPACGTPFQCSAPE